MEGQFVNMAEAIGSARSILVSDNRFSWARLANLSVGHIIFAGLSPSLALGRRSNHERI